MAISKSPVIFIGPLSPSMKTLKKALTEIEHEEGIDIFESSSLPEINQLIPTIGPCIIILPTAEYAERVLFDNKKYISQTSSKSILVSQGNVTPLVLVNLNKLGLTECMVDPVLPKTLLHKVKLFLKALPIARPQKEDRDASFDVMKVSAKNPKAKEDAVIESNKALRLERGVAYEDSPELVSKKSATDHLSSYIDNSKQRLERGMKAPDVEKPTEPTTNQTPEVTSSNAGKTKFQPLDVEDGDKKHRPVRLELNKEDSSPKKTALLNLVEKNNKKTSNQDKEPGLNYHRPSMPNLDLEESNKNASKPSLLLKTAKEFGGKPELKDINSHKKDDSNIINIIDYKKLKKEFEEASSLQGQKPLGESSSKTNKNQNTDEEFEIPGLFPRSVDLLISVQKLYALTNSYQEEKLDKNDIAQFLTDNLFNKEKAICSFFVFNKKINQFVEYFIGQLENKNIVSSLNENESWQGLYSMNFDRWQGHPYPAWSDPTFKAKNLEFIYPYYEGNTKVAFAVVHFRDSFSKERAEELEAVLESARGALIECFHQVSNTKRKGNHPHSSIKKENFIVAFIKKLYMRLAS